MIDAQQAATAAEANALGGADATLGAAEAAEVQAAAQESDEENAYLNYQSFQQYEKAGFDVAILATSLGVSEIDPVWAVSALLNVVGDGVGFGFSGPDPNSLILQGIQTISQQLSDFEQYTQTAFQVVDTQLANISSQVSQIAADITDAQMQLTRSPTRRRCSRARSTISSRRCSRCSLRALATTSARWSTSTSASSRPNGTPLPQTQFAQAAGAVYQDATSTALTQTLLTVPTGFDALDADGLIAGADPLTLDTNINLFNFFGAGPTDDPPTVGWPGALDHHVPPERRIAAGLCLPDPDFWATSARAFGQLLLENPKHVTPTASRSSRRSTRRVRDRRRAHAALDRQRGHRLGGVNNGSGAINGTGNKHLDAALSYYAYWGGARKHQTTTAPPLPIAVGNEENTILANSDTPGVVTGSNYGSAAIPYAGVDPWLGADQLPDLGNIVKLSSLQSVPVCPSEPNLGNDFNFATQDLLPAGAAIDQAEIAFLSPDVLNAVRLGQGTLYRVLHGVVRGPLDGRRRSVQHVAVLLLHRWVVRRSARRRDRRQRHGQLLRPRSGQPGRQRRHGGRRRVQRRRHRLAVRDRHHQHTADRAVHA